MTFSNAWTTRRVTSPRARTVDDHATITNSSAKGVARNLKEVRVHHSAMYAAVRKPPCRHFGGHPGSNAPQRHPPLSVNGNSLPLTTAAEVVQGRSDWADAETQQVTAGRADDLFTVGATGIADRNRSAPATGLLEPRTWGHHTSRTTLPLEPPQPGKFDNRNSSASPPTEG